MYLYLVSGPSHYFNPTPTASFSLKKIRKKFEKLVDSFTNPTVYVLPFLKTIQPQQFLFFVFKN